MSYGEILERIQEELELVRADFLNSRNSNFHANLLTTDFSEMWVYMYQGRTQRTDLRLVRYLFDKNLTRDYQLTFLLPTIVEMRMYYERLRGTLAQTSESWRTIASSPEIADLLSAYDRIPQKARTEIAQSAISYKEDDRARDVLTKWKNVRQVHGPHLETAFLSTIEPGANYMVDTGHHRLMELLKSNVIRRPQEVDELKGRVQEIQTDMNIFEGSLRLLKDRRPGLLLSNLVDAEQAGMTSQVNQDILGDHHMMSIYSGSIAPRAIWEAVLKVEKEGRVRTLVRSPLYLMIRTFCSNELPRLHIGRAEFLHAANDALQDLRNLSPERVLKDLGKYGTLSDAEGRALYMLFFLRTFFVSENLAAYIEDALRSEKYYDFLRGYLGETLLGSTASIRELTARKLVELGPGDLTNVARFEDELKRTGNSMFEKTKELYEQYYKALEGYDAKKLSPMMREYYHYVVKEPVETVEHTGRPRT